jgi:hypothetical protein
MTTDRLALAHVIEEAGIQRAGAERIASAIFDAISDNVATKQDIATVNARIDLVRADIAALEQRLAVRFEQTERRIDVMVTRLGALAVVLLGLLFAALHYWPPGHG